MKRKPQVAGKFYPGTPEELDSFFKAVLETPDLENNQHRIKGLLVPHAGYIYSGKTAARAYSLIKGTDFKTALILGTCHTMSLPGCGLVKNGSFVTPYGEIEIDADITSKLCRSKFFEELESAHLQEHSVEVQLPFLQYLKRGEKFKIVPLVCNSSDPRFIKGAGEALGEILSEPGNLLIISSDLSHYPMQEIAEVSDKALIQAYTISTANRDSDFFSLAAKLLQEKFRDELDTAACGFSPMAVGSVACVKAGYANFTLADYSNSGDVSGDKESVVGYVSGSFTDETEKNCKISLSEEEKKDLLSFARRAVEYRLENGSEISEIKSHIPAFNIPAAVFVTLTSGGRLRGCIGTMSPHSLLLDAVCEYASRAAFEDGRFSPVSAEELKKIKVEISILSPLRRVSGHDEVKEKEHGVYVRKGSRSGTFLPQVWEHFEKKEDFLSSLCAEKAGLSKDAWKEKSTELYIYSVDSFKEE